MSEKYPFMVRVNWRTRDPMNYNSPNIRHAISIADKHIGRPDVRSVRIYHEIYVHISGQTED